MISTINLPDSIEKGYSHFYSEVRRVKYTAQQIKERKKIIVIFDELFRGTNVKEAYEASLMIISAFAKIRSSLFLISTHIVEVSEKLSEHKNILFKCFQSKLNGETPVYNYQITAGISADRMGLRILKNENIIEILDQAIDDQQT
jgi:DNA mismatch repair ATPase MutS